MASKNLRNLSEFEELAKTKLEDFCINYFFKGSNNSRGLRRNVEGLERILLCPDVCVDVSSRDTKVNFFGMNFSMPVGIGPCALHQLATEEGEVATAKGAEKANVLYVVSMYSQRSLSDIRKAAPNARIMFQANVLSERFLNKEYIQRIEKHGIKGFVFTVDHNSFAPDRPILEESRRHTVDFPNMPEGFCDYARAQNTLQKWTNDTYTWEFIKKLISYASVPVIIKGILSPKNALEAVKAGASGVWISNHGGRNSCHLPATIDAFRRIAPIMKKLGVPMFADGGIQNGGDVLKFLALGAKMVFVAKPVISSLAVNGAEGVSDMFSILQADLESTLAMCGYNRIDEVDEKCLWDNKANL